MRWRGPSVGAPWFAMSLHVHRPRALPDLVDWLSFCTSRFAGPRHADRSRPLPDQVDLLFSSIFSVYLAPLAGVVGFAVVGTGAAPPVERSAVKYSPAHSHSSTASALQKSQKLSSPNTSWKHINGHMHILGVAAATCGSGGTCQSPSVCHRARRLSTGQLGPRSPSPTHRDSIRHCDRPCVLSVADLGD